MKLGKERTGDLYILGSALLWGLFPIITILSYNTISPLLSLTVSSFFAAIFFAILITRKKIWHTLKNREAIKNILYVTVIIGIFVYLLYFIALQFTTPGNVSIVAETELLFSFLIFHALKGEHLPRHQIFGAILMVTGALIVLFPHASTFRFGDFLIIIAAFIAPFGNFYSQKARKLVSSEVIMFVRSIVSAFVILIIALLLKTSFEPSAIHSALPFLLINGIFLLGLSKIWWIDGIHRISVPKANALASICPLFTLFFAWLILKQPPTILQLVAIVPITAGIILLSKQNNAAEVSV